jgi:hypothetical protein
VTTYFVYVSSALAALLFIADLCFPEPLVLFPDHSQIVDKLIIRIKCAHEWPAKVVLDTSLPVQPPAGEVSQIAQRVPRSFFGGVYLKRSRIRSITALAR